MLCVGGALCVVGAVGLVKVCAARAASLCSVCAFASLFVFLVVFS